MANILSSDFWINNPNKRKAQRVYDSQERDVNTPNSFFNNLKNYKQPNTNLGNIASGIPQPTDNPMLSLNQNTDVSSLLQSFKPAEYAGSQVEKSFGLDAEKEAEARYATEVQSPVLKSTDNSNDSHQRFMDNQQQQTNDLIRQGMNNQYGMQGANSTNSTIAYNNNLQAGLAVAANSQRAGSFTPHYQQAVAYTPQAMNFGNNQQQPTNMAFGNQPDNSTLGRIGNINGLNMYDANGQLQSFNKQQITDAGKKMEGKFIGADNQLHDKSVMGGFTANNENYKQLQNLGKRNLFNQIEY